MKNNLMENTEGQKANARGENNDKIKRAVLDRCRARLGGLQRATQRRIIKNRNKNRLATHEATGFISLIS